MKKSLTIAAFAGMLAVVACGPSAEEKAAIEKAKQDSITAVEKMKADSIAAAATADQEKLAAEAAEKAKQDSIAAAEAAAKEKKELYFSFVKNPGACRDFLFVFE
ncbi:MAG: hypothetical protein IT235_03550 [Bacteroidia bacterium]|nr:hypothetical protein [Bacteroidia bacterium]